MLKPRLKMGNMALPVAIQEGPAVKKLLLILFGLGIVAAIAYAFGTEAGRARRDDLLARAGKRSSSTAPTTATSISAAIRTGCR